MLEETNGWWRRVGSSKAPVATPSPARGSPPTLARMLTGEEEQLAGRPCLPGWSVVMRWKCGSHDNGSSLSPPSLSKINELKQK